MADYAKTAAQGPVLVVSRRKPIAAVVSIKGMDLETATVSMSPVFQEIIRRFRERQKVEGGVTAEQLRERLGLKPKRRKPS